MRDRIDLFVVSALVLFLEIASIRWFPAQVLFLTFFTNTVLLACFLGMSVGCLAANRRSNYLTWTPALLAIALGVAQCIEPMRVRMGGTIEVGSGRSPQFVFFGTESLSVDPSKFIIPVEAVSGVVFILIALAMLGPGQQLGRAIAKVPNRVGAYTINIAGSIAGVLLFTACSRWQLGPIWWFGIVVGGLVYVLLAHISFRALALAAGSAAVLFFAGGGAISFPGGGPNQLWSPYYRIDYNPGDQIITVNLIGHQQMISREGIAPAYALPHLLNRDAGRPPFAQVLIIGAGSGNDVSRALQWGADRVDAVEIDPVIQSLGKANHPDHPYDDPRVIVHLGDGRNYLHSTREKYDLIVYALVDSLVLHSSYSNIRLESYLFTMEAFEDIRQRLKPGGVFVMYNYFRQGWIVARLKSMLEATFGSANPLVFNLPPRDTVRPDDVMFGDFTIFVSGATLPIKKAFAEHPLYQISMDRKSDPSVPDGFKTGGSQPDWPQVHPSTVTGPSTPAPFATDAWPFLYLQRPMIPALSLRGMAIMGAIALVFLAPFVRRRRSDPALAPNPDARPGVLPQMVFLGAGFMLVETKAVVQMALLFGSTWFVNAIVLVAVLVMILCANLFVLAFRPRTLTPFYIGLIASLVISAVVPLDIFLGLSRGPQIAASCLLAFTPILFAGVVFAVSFSHAADTTRAFGMNIAGAMLGGLSEYTSMLIGFQYLALVALLFYALSWLSTRRAPLTAT